MRVGLACVLLASLACAAQAKERPSFDCSRAGTAIEKRICGDDYVAEADRYLANVFKERLSRASDEEKKALVLEQREWLKSLRSVCGVRDDPNRDFPWRGDMRDCLAGEYNMRIERVEQPLRNFVDLAEDAPKAGDICAAVSGLATIDGARVIIRHALPVRQLKPFDHGLPEDLVDPRLRSQSDGADAYDELKGFGADGWRIFAGRVKLWADKPESWVLWTIVGTAHNPSVYLFNPIPPGDKPGEYVGHIGEEASGPFDWLFVRFRGRPYVLLPSVPDPGTGMEVHAMEVLDLDWSKNVCRKD